MRSLVVALVVSLAGTPAMAQEWSNEQQELINHVQGCWDAWVESLPEPTPAQFLAVCPIDERAHWWWAEEGAPASFRANTERRWQDIRKERPHWVSLRPIYVDIFGDTGIIHLYGQWSSEIDGETVLIEDMRTEVFQHRGNQWILIGAHGGPTS